MANTKSALKRVRQTKTRTRENQGLKTRVKSARKAALAAIESNDQAEAARAVSNLFSAADTAVKRGAIHKNVSRRLKSKFAARLAATA